MLFLDKTDDGVDHHHPHDDCCVDPVPQCRRDHSGPEEDVNQHVVEVLEEPLENSLLLAGGEAVRSGGLEAPAGFLRGQPRRSAVEFGTDVVRGKRVRIPDSMRGFVELTHGSACFSSAFPARSLLSG
jgi:hypothetical protein